MPERPIVLLHGYSATASSLRAWRELLVARGYDASTIRMGNYISLSNEITIKDIAEAFDRALRAEGGLEPDEPFDAIVHSTGGLIIREWLRSYEARRGRVKHIIGLAPAMFGSPLAGQGRSWLGAVFKGNRDVLSPDFLEAGNRVLAGLELGSPYTWDLAHRDLVGETAVYGATADTPWPFIFIGTEAYSGLRRLFVNPPGSDGTVRWSGAALNTRKLIVDLRRVVGEAGDRIVPAAWSNVDVPLVLVDGCNHGTIAAEPPDALVEMVFEALAVEDLAGYRAWAAEHAALPDGLERWQQFVVRAVDERGDPVSDYYIDIGTLDDGEFQVLDHFALDVHPDTEDPSYRCFHVNLTELQPETRATLAMRLIAQSGTELVAYVGDGSETFTPEGDPRDGKWDAQLDLTDWLNNSTVDFFHPYTTTLIEIVLNREPLPPTGITQLLRFVEEDSQ